MPAHGSICGQAIIVRHRPGGVEDPPRNRRAGKSANDGTPCALSDSRKIKGLVTARNECQPSGMRSTETSNLGVGSSNLSERASKGLMRRVFFSIAGALVRMSDTFRYIKEQPRSHRDQPFVSKDDVRFAPWTRYPCLS